MRALLLCAAACGRVGFGATGDGGRLDDASVDGAVGGGIGVPPGVTVVGSVGTAGTMAGVGGGAVGELRVVAVAWQATAQGVVAISDTAGDTWNMPFAVQAANGLQLAMFYAIASSPADTITATISPAPSNSAIVIATFAGQGAYLGQGTGTSTHAASAPVIWFPKSAGLGVVAIASDVEIGATGMTPAGATASNAIHLDVFGTTADANTSIPLTASAGYVLGELSFQP